MNILPIKPNIKITIFGEDHDPSKEFELIHSNSTSPFGYHHDQDTKQNEYSKVVNTNYGLSAMVIYKKSKITMHSEPNNRNWDFKENSYTIMHNLREVHYLHSIIDTDSNNNPVLECAFEGWGRGRNMFYFGKRAKEMHIIKSLKWFDEDKDYFEYYYHDHPPITESVHPTWTGYLPPYAAQPINA
jgi:hypothetical protein